MRRVRLLLAVCDSAFEERFCVLAPKCEWRNRHMRLYLVDQYMLPIVKTVVQ